jgi:hypothetical protein
VLSDISNAAQLTEGLVAECEGRLRAVYDAAEAGGDSDTMMLVSYVWSNISVLNTSNVTLKDRSKVLARLATEALRERDDAEDRLEDAKREHRELMDDLTAVNRDNPLVNDVVKVVETRVGDEALAAAYCMASNEVRDEVYDEVRCEMYNAIYDGIEIVCGAHWRQAAAFLHALSGDFEITEDQRARLSSLIAEIAAEFEASRQRRLRRDL